MGAIRSLVVCSLVWVGLSTVVRAGEVRNWVDVRGNQVPGALVDVTADQMVVLLVDGAEVSIPLKVFSEGDQKYLREQMPEKVKQAPAKATSSQALTQQEQAKEVASQELTGADLYQPPSTNQNIHYFCTNCDGDLSASIGVGDHCPQCDILIEYEEDEHGNVVKGTKELPWWGRLVSRIATFVVIFVVSTAWKFRRLIPFG